MWQKLMVLTLVALLVHTPEFSTSLMAKPSPRAEAIQRKLEQVGVGSYVALKLTDGRKLKGRLEAIGQDGLTVNLLSGEDRQARVAYERLAKLKVVKKRSYRATGPPKPAFARLGRRGPSSGHSCDGQGARRSDTSRTYSSHRWKQLYPEVGRKWPTETH